MSDSLNERVLVIGDDMRIFLTVIRSLGRAGKEIHAAPFERHAPALRSKYVSMVHHLPRYHDDPIAWRNALLRVLEDYRFNLVIPCCDRAILPLHVHRQAFDQYPLAIPNPICMELLFDKQHTRELCAKLQIPIAAGGQIGAGETADTLVRRFGLPIALKPRRSFGIEQFDSRGQVVIVETKDELQKRLSSLPERSRYLVETYFRGVGVGLSVLAHDGKILQAFQHRRLREGRGGSSARVSEEINENLYQACQKICGYTKLTGVCMFEFRYNPDTGDWVLLETNARFWGSLPLPVSLGVDFPRLLYDLLALRIQHAPVGYPAGIRARNLALDGLNLIASLRDSWPNDIGRWFADFGDFLTQPIRWFSGAERSDTFVIDDPFPAIWECLTLFRKTAQKLAGHRSMKPCHRARQTGAGTAQTGAGL
jgi:predicted ATP-grasp superfamily ATP-dependent carboligase